MKRVRDAFFLLLGIGIVVWSFLVVLDKPAPAKYQNYTGNSYVVVGDQMIEVEIAETEEARERGLSGRESLAAGHGLLFLFESPGMHGFWMKDMRFPIDIVWIDEDWVVLGVERGAEPASYPDIFSPPAPVRSVLEIPAGQARAYGIDTGSKLFLDR